MSSTATIIEIDEFNNQTIIGEMYLDVDPFSIDEAEWAIND
jgi:hypothetical protein